MSGGKVKLRISLSLCVLFAAGCSTTPPLTDPQDLSVVAGTELPPPTTADVTSIDPNFVIGPLDRLRIDVLGMPDMSNRVVQVDNSGNIAFATANAIPAAGRTPAQVAQEIEQSLRANYFRDPQVTVNMEQAAPRSITVFGEVREPGVYPVTGRMTLMRAIASGRGLSEVASRDEVIIFRNVNGQRYAAVYSLRAIRAGSYPDPQVFPNDVVAVGESVARRRLRDAIALAPLITTPLILLLQ